VLFLLFLKCEVFQMKKILFLILGSTVACSSVNAMKNPLDNKFALLGETSVIDQKPLTHDINDSKKAPTKLISTPHAKEQMKKSGFMKRRPNTENKAQKIKKPESSSVNTKVNRDGKLVELFYTDHAKTRMDERGITEFDVEIAIGYGKKFLDTKTNSIRYCGKTLDVVTEPTDQPNKIAIITVFFEREDDTKMEAETKSRKIVNYQSKHKK
jgi:hypothetical protein